MTYIAQILGGPQDGMELPLTRLAQGIVMLPRPVTAYYVEELADLSEPIELRVDHYYLHRDFDCRYWYVYEPIHRHELGRR